MKLDILKQKSIQKRESKENPERERMHQYLLGTLILWQIINNKIISHHQRNLRLTIEDLSHSQTQISNIEEFNFTLKHSFKMSNGQTNNTLSQQTSPLKKETLIKPQNHNLFNNPEQYYHQDFNTTNQKRISSNSLGSHLTSKDQDNQDLATRQLSRQGSQQSNSIISNYIQQQIDSRSYSKINSFVDLELKSQPSQKRIFMSPTSILDTLKDDKEDQSIQGKKSARPRQNIFPQSQGSFKREKELKKENKEGLVQDNFLKYIHPKQRETIYLLFGEKKDHWQQSRQSTYQQQSSLHQQQHQTSLMHQQVSQQNTVSPPSTQQQESHFSRDQIGSHSSSQKKKEIFVNGFSQALQKQSIIQENTSAHTYYQKLDQKAEILKDMLRDTSKVISHMMERRKKFLIEHQELIKGIENSKDIIEQSQKTPKVKVFERDIQLRVEQIKLSIQDLKDKYREANDLIVIFSIQSNHYLSSPPVNPNAQASKSQSESGRIVWQPQSTNNMLDFDSRALQIYEEFQQKIGNLDQGLNEYKKYLKLDIEGEEFNLRTQELLIILKQCEQFKLNAEQEIVFLNQELGVNLKEIALSLKQNVEFYSRIYLSIEESFDLVSKLLYLRKWKFKEIEEQIQSCNAELDKQSMACFKKYEGRKKGFVEGNQFANEYKGQMKSLQFKIKEVRSNCQQVKQDVRQIACDNRCQYFIRLRFRQCNKVLLKLDEVESNVKYLEGQFEFVFLQLEKELVHTLQYSQAITLLKTKLKEISSKMTKNRDEQLRQVYFNTIPLLADLNVSINSSNFLQQVNSLPNLKKSLSTLKAFLESLSAGVQQLQQEIEQEQQKKGRTEQQEISIRRIEELSENCKKELDQFRKVKDVAFFNFEEAERYHTAAMVALGSARQAFQMIKDDKDGISQEIPQQLVKQVTSQKNSLELTNCIFDNTSYLQISNFQELTFVFTTKQDNNDTKIIFDTNLDELLQGVDESHKNIKQVWESVRKQTYEKFLGDIAEKLVLSIGGLHDFVIFWNKALKFIAKDIIQVYTQHKGVIPSEIKEQIISNQINQLCKFLQERIKKSLQSELEGVLVLIEQKARESCVNLVIFVCEGVIEQIAFDNLDEQLAQLEYFLMDDEFEEQRITLKNMEIFRQIVAFVEQETVSEEINIRVRQLRIILGSLLLAECEYYSKDYSQSSLVMIDIIKQIALPEESSPSAQQQQPDNNNENKNQKQDQLTSAIDLCLQLSSRNALVNKITSQIKSYEQTIILFDDADYELEKTNKKENQNSSFSYENMLNLFTNYYLIQSKSVQINSKLSQLCQQSPSFLRKNFSDYILANNLMVEKDLKLNGCYDLQLFVYYFQAVHMFQSTLLSPPYLFLLEYNKNPKDFSLALSHIQASLKILKEGNLLNILQTKYISSRQINSDQQPLLKSIGLFTKIKGFNRANTFKEGQKLNAWIQIVEGLLDFLQNLENRKGSNYRDLLSSLESIQGMELSHLKFIKYLEVLLARK